MNKEEFLNQYKGKEWYETSKRIKARDHNTCQMCGSNDRPLSVHHLYYERGGGLSVPDSSLITLCEGCHRLVHDFDSKANDLLRYLKEEFTAFEIYIMMLEMAKHGCSVGYASFNPKPIKTKSSLVNGHLERLQQWRVKVNREAIIDALVNFVCIDMAYNEDNGYRKKFEEEVGVSFDEYVKQHNIDIEAIIKEERNREHRTPTEIPF